VAAAAPLVASPRPSAAESETPREERRLVTALFCDLVGYTTLTERLDAEEMRTLQGSYFDRMSAQIVRFGGQVEKFAGDAVLALFGVPVARGDDAQRAILCAMAMQDAMVALGADARRRWKADLALRIGVNTGEAVTGLRDTAGRKDYSVTGDMLNTAARLQAAAEPGTIVAGEETMRLTRKTIRFGERLELTLKGKTRPVAAYQVLGQRARTPAREDDGQASPLLGRDHELAVLLDSMAFDRGQMGRLVTIAGEPGLGKSRLIAEAIRLAGATHDVYRARAVSYGQDISLYLIGDLVRAIAGLPEVEDPEAARRQLDETIRGFLGDETAETQTAGVDILAELVGLRDSTAESGIEAQTWRRALVKTLRLVLLALSRVRPAVLVLDDLQWIDAASAEVLGAVLADVPTARICVLTAHRSGWIPPWAAWSWTERLHLQPLYAADADRLAQHILGHSTIAPGLHDWIAERAAGNPFFIEELLHVLRETGGVAEIDGQLDLVPSAAARIPSTLTETLLARLDALDDEARALLQTASVIGSDFDVEILSRIAGQSVTAVETVLERLQHAEIVVRRAGNHAERSFKHVPMRDVTYHTLLTPRRHELHHAVADAILSLRPADESVDLVSFHLSQTDDHALAAVWLELAGNRAVAVYDNQTAIGRYEEARRRLDLAGGDVVARARVTEKLGGIFRVVGWFDEALEELEAAADMYKQLADQGAESRTVAQIGEVHFLRGATDEAIERIREVLWRLDQDEDAATEGTIALYAALVDPLQTAGRYEDAVTALWRALELAQSIGDSAVVTDATVRYAQALTGMGLLDQAREILDGCMTSIDDLALTGVRVRALTLSGTIDLEQGRPVRAAEAFEQALEIARERGDPGAEAMLLGRCGDAAFVLGDWADGRARYEAAVDLVRSMSFAHFSAVTMMALGEQYLREGDRERATRHLEEPLTIVGQHGGTAQALRLQIPLAVRDVLDGRPEVALQKLSPLLSRPDFETAPDHRPMQIAAEAYLLEGDVTRAMTIIDVGLHFAEEQSARLQVAHWIELNGMVAERRGDVEQAGSLFEAGLALTREMPYPYMEARILSRLGHLHGDRDMIADARHIFERLGAQPDVARLDAMGAVAGVPTAVPRG